MANTDNPCGLTPIKHKTGGKIWCMQWPLYGSNSAIGIGDPVKLLATGDVDLASGGGDRLLGISAEYKGDSCGDDYILVYSDPAIVFQVQIATGVDAAQTHIGNLADLNATTLSTTLLRGRREIDGSTLETGSGVVRILGLVLRPDNAWGAHADLEVEIYEHELSKEEPGTPGV